MRPLLLFLSLLTALCSCEAAEPPPLRRGVYLELEYFSGVKLGRPTTLARRPEVAVIVRPKHQSAEDEAGLIVSWHEGVPLVLPQARSLLTAPCLDEARSDVDGTYDVAEISPGVLVVCERTKGMSWTFRWAGTDEDVAVAFHAIGGTWHDNHGGLHVFAEDGTWRGPGFTRRYKAILDHVFVRDDLIEVEAVSGGNAVLRTSDGRALLGIEVSGWEPRTLRLRPVVKGEPDRVWPYSVDQAKVWLTLQR